MYTLIDGKTIAAEIKDVLKDRIEAARDEYWAPIGLAVVIVGEDPASQIYVKNKIKTAEALGIQSFLFELPEDTQQEELLRIIKALNNRNDVNGILVQLPLPKHIDEEAVVNAIAVEKDVDGFSPEQTGRMVLGKKSLVPCTPKGIMELLHQYGIEIAGKNAVVIGRSNTVGKPVANLLLKESATVTVCHSKTENLGDFTRNADIIVVAVGKPKLLKGDMVKEGAVVIDVGINRTPEGLKGDVDFEEVAPKCSYITPVPGGVGPMTIAMLMSNTLDAYLEQNAR